MRALVQRVTGANVRVATEVVGAIEAGCCVLLGVTHTDDDAHADRLADKVMGLRIFDDDTGRMNRSIRDVGGSLLVVSQFTLYADCARGRRPSYTAAASPDQARRLYERFIERARREIPVATGRFGASMQLSLTNDGPVTILLDSTEVT